LSVGILVIGGAALLSRVATTTHYRRLIADADSIDVYYFLQNNPSTKTKVATISSENDIYGLAQEIEASGLWMPVDDLVAHSYELVLKKDGRVYGAITVRGGHRIREGRWTTSISPATAARIRELAGKHGQGVPDPRELLQPYGGTSGDEDAP
jgi:hypothetical protein